MKMTVKQLRQLLDGVKEHEQRTVEFRVHGREVELNGIASINEARNMGSDSNGLFFDDSFRLVIDFVMETETEIADEPKTAQEVFDVVAKQLLKQNSKSMKTDDFWRCV